MKLRRVMVFLCACGLAFSFSVSAAPWHDDSGPGYNSNKPHKHKHKKGKSRDNGRYAEKGPPPWAPAHGYRRKQQEDGYREEHREIVVHTEVRDDDRYREHESPEVEFEMASQKIGISSGTCNREAIGAVMGGIIGGVIGNKTASGDKKTLATIAGSLIGVVVGKEIGRKMDNEDAHCTNQALERAQDGQTIAWENPETGQQYSVTPYETYQQDDGRYCRKYRAVVEGDSRTKRYGETACRTDDGVWEKRT